MVECGNFSDPPQRSNITIWAIVELVAFVVYGCLAIGGIVAFVKNFSSSPVSGILNFVSDGCFIVAMVLLIWGFCKDDQNKLKLGLCAFGLGSLLALAVFILGLVFGFKGIYVITIFKGAIGGFLCFMIYKQYKKIEEGGGTSS